MICKHCGAEVGTEYRLCPYCRSEIEYPNSNNQQPQIIIQNVVPNGESSHSCNVKKKKKKKQIKNKALSAVIISSFVVLLALLLFVIIFISLSKKYIDLSIVVKARLDCPILDSPYTNINLYILVKALSFESAFLCSK